MDVDEALLINQIFNDLFEAEEDVELARARRFFRREDAFQLSDTSFIKNFRLSKNLVRELIDTVLPYLNPLSRRSALSAEMKVLATLHFYGHGTYQEGVGKHIFTAISQSSVSKCLNEVTNALNNDNVMQQFIHFPANLDELRKCRSRFFRKYQFPGVIGCVDGTHVAIVRPNEDEHIYVNRKHYHSLNVQLVCDENLKIMSVNPRFPGSSHDSHVWRQSQVSRVLENVYRRLDESFFLLGDSGYPLRPWLLTPLADPTPGTPEWRFNNRFKSVRSIIERCNGVLKNRFRCLLRHRVLHYEPDTAAKIVNACVILHNMCIDRNVPEPGNDDVINFDFGMYRNEAAMNDPMYGVNADLARGRQLRDQIIAVHFN